MKRLQQKQFGHSAPNASCQKKAQSQVFQTEHRIQCCYTNSTPQFQIIRVANVCTGFLERMVMPYAKVIFEAHRDDHLEIHMGNPISAILSDKIPCYRLTYQEERI